MSVSSVSRAELAVSRRGSILSSALSVSEDPLDALFNDFQASSSPCRNHSGIVTAKMFAPADASVSSRRPRYDSSSSSSSCSSTASPLNGPMAAPVGSLTPEEEDLIVSQIVEEDLLESQLKDEADEYIMDRLLAREELLKSMAEARAEGKPRVFDWAMLYADELATGGPLVEVVPYEAPKSKASDKSLNWADLYQKEKAELEAKKIEATKEKTSAKAEQERKDKAAAVKADNALKLAWIGANSSGISKSARPAEPVSRPKQQKSSSLNPEALAWFGKAAVKKPEISRAHTAPRSLMAVPTKPQQQPPAAQPRFFPSAKSSPPKINRSAPKSSVKLSPVPRIAKSTSLKVPVASPRFQLSRSAGATRSTDRSRSNSSSPDLAPQTAKPTSSDPKGRFARPDFRKLASRSEPSGLSLEGQSKLASKPTTSRFANIFSDDKRPGMKRSKTVGGRKSNSGKRLQTVRTFSAAEYFKNL